MPKKPAGKKITKKPPKMENENSNNMDNDTTTTTVNVGAAAAAPSSSSTKHSPSPAKPPSSSSAISFSPFKSSPGGTTTASDHNQNRSTTNHAVVPSFRNVAPAATAGGGGGGGGLAFPTNPKEYLTFVRSWLHGTLAHLWRDLDKILPAAGQSTCRESAIQALQKEYKWFSRSQVEDALMKLERLLLVGREVPRHPTSQKAPTLIFRVLTSRKERTAGYTFATQEMKKNWHQVAAAIMSKNLSLLKAPVVHENHANQKNSVSTTTGTANQHHQQSLLPAPPPAGVVTMTSAPRNNSGSTTTTTDPSSNPNYASLKTATKLYLDNLKNLPNGLERSSLKTLLAHSEGWQDLQMQDQFLTELATKNFIRLERDPSNPAIVKVFCNNSNNTNNNNNLSGTRRERSPPKYNISNNMMPTMMNSNPSYPPQQYHHQNSIQQQQMYSAITNNGINNSMMMMSMRRNPIVFPPPLIVREGAPLMRSNPQLLVFAPPPFFVNGK